MPPLHAGDDKIARADPPPKPQASEVEAQEVEEFEEKQGKNFRRAVYASLLVEHRQSVKLRGGTAEA